MKLSQQNYDTLRQMPKEQITEIVYGGGALQDEFVAEVKAAVKEGMDHCPCKDAGCKHHGNCFACVQIHRGHGMHLPYCMQKMLNKRLEAVSALTEHTIVNEVQIPDYLK